MEDDIVDRLLRVKSPQLKYLLHETAEEIRRIRAERDHARRLHCYAVAGTMQGRAAEDVAKCLGWHCFKEERCSTG